MEQELSPEDQILGAAISRPARYPEDNLGLRSLLVHRLTGTTKAVARIGLRNDRISVFCEGCGVWTPVEEFPLEFDCNCGRSFTTEFVVMEEIDPDEDEEDDADEDPRPEIRPGV